MSADAVKGLGSAIEATLRRAAQATGVDFSFLVRTARRESGFHAEAHAAGSTAAGMFQFVEQTWLSTLKRHGVAHGYARYAELIQQGADGRFHVDGDEAKRAVMDLRYDPHAASVMAGALATDHAAYLRGRVGRQPTAGELYAAHFLGPQGSARLIEAYEGSPNAPAASLLPDAAAANHGVFYREGRPLTVAQLYTDLSRTAGGGPGLSMDRDPGQPAFASYAGARRNERLAEQEMLLNMLLNGGDKADTAPTLGLRGYFSAEMLSVLARGREDPPG